ncbi:MAG: AzlD domain-containing protein [Faecalibacillus faecis]
MLFVRYHLSLLIKNYEPNHSILLDYIPYTVLAAMTFPDIFYSTGHLISGIVATIIIIYASYKELSLIQVACIGCFVVVMIELIL